MSTSDSCVAILLVSLSLILKNKNLKKGSKSFKIPFKLLCRLCSTPPELKACTHSIHGAYPFLEPFHSVRHFPPLLQNSVEIHAISLAWYLELALP